MESNSEERKMKAKKKKVITKPWANCSHYEDATYEHTY